MTLTYKFGEFGEVNPIRCKDSNDQDANIAYADVTKSTVYFLTENKTKILVTIDDADFTITSPNIDWVPTLAQSKLLPPGNYTGEAHLQDTGLTRKAIFEFPIFVEKAKENIV